MLGRLRTHRRASLHKSMRRFIHRLGHVVVPPPDGEGIDEINIYFECIIACHIEVPHPQLRRPAVTVRFERNVVVRLSSVAFIYEVEGFGVVFVLLRASLQSKRLSHFGHIAHMTTI